VITRSIRTGAGSGNRKGYRQMFRKLVPILVIIGFVAVGFVGGVLAEEDAEESAFEYVGVKRCKTCHKKEASGDQYGKWLEGAHAKAYESLASEESIAKAEELGLGNPQEAPECLECHATAFAVMGDAKAKITLEEGVSCESCHGAGSEYKSKKTMVALAKGEIDPASVGLMTPTEETCVGCHNPDNPFHEEFVFEEFLAKIAHPYPEGYDPAAGGGDDEGEDDQ
jgi:hypothetical protein